MHYIISQGSYFASKINGAITVAKFIPVIIFILVGLFAFKPEVFTADLWGNAGGTFQFSDIWTQLRFGLIATVWVYTGVEGAVTY